MTKILYASFNGCNNTSKLLLDKIEITSQDKLYLKNSFISSVVDLRKKIINDNYDLIICFGQWKIVDADTLRIETLSRCPDNMEDTLLTNFDYEILTNYLDTNNIQYKISENAGDYLCNHIYYHGLKIIIDNNLHTKMLFIHLPIMKKMNRLDEFAQTFKSFYEK